MHFDQQRLQRQRFVHRPAESESPVAADRASLDAPFQVLPEHWRGRTVRSQSLPRQRLARVASE